MTHKFAWILIFISTYTSHFTIFGQNVFFDQIQQPGIHQDGIFDITQDNNGFLWLATHKGLVRYDGIHTVAYEHFYKDDHLIPCDKVFELSVDKNNDILAITTSGLCKYFQHEDRFQQIPHQTIGIHSKICQTNSSNTLITSSTGILCLTKNNEIKDVAIAGHAFFPQQEKIKNIFHATDSLFFIAAENGGIGVAQYDYRQNILKIISYSYRNAVFNTIERESDSTYYIGFKTFISRINLTKTGQIKALKMPGTHPIFSLKMSSITDILVSTNKNIYISTVGNGLIEINSNDGHIKRYLQSDNKNSLKWNTLLCLFEDKSGVIWIGKGQGGITKIDTKRKPFFNLKHNPMDKKSLSHDYINPILIDSKGYLWAGTLQGELNRSINHFSETHISEFEFELIYKKDIMRYALFQLNNYVIIGAGTTILFYNLDTEQFTTLPPGSKLHHMIGNNPIFNFGVDHKNRLWIGGAKGLLCVDYHNNFQNVITGNCSQVPIKTLNGVELNERVNQILCMDSLGTYIAMNHGLFTVAEEKDTLYLNHYYYDPNNEMSLSHSRVTSICKDYNHQLWVGTYNGGLNKINLKNNNIIGFYNRKNLINLPVSSIFDIQTDDKNNLWIASQKGIIKYDIQHNSYIQYAYPLPDGNSKLNIKAGAKTKDGQLLFGGNNGIVAFNPDRILINDIPAQVALTGLQILGKPIKVNEKIHNTIILPASLEVLDQITIPHECNNFTIEFSTLHYSSPENNSIKYRLKGIDNNWHRTSALQNTVNYPRLPHGNYTFQLKALNSDNVENQEIKELHICILPPWYLTWMAKLSFGLVFCCLLFIIYKYLHNISQLKQSLKLEGLAKQQDKELFEMKQQFFTNVSHEFKTPLSLIIGPVESMMKNSKSSDSKNLSLVLRNALRLQRLINQLLDFRKLEQKKMQANLQKADINELIQDVLLAYEYAFKKAELKVQFINKVEKIECWFDYDKIEKVLYNLISNVCKYSKKNSQVLIKSLIDKNEFVFSILNEGEGIPPSKKLQIFDRFYQLKNKSSGTGIGLSMTKEFIELHKGTIKEIGKYGENSEFVFTLPLNHTPFTNVAIYQNSHIKAPYCIENSDKELSEDKQQSILIVEDNLDMIDFISDIFQQHFQILTAINGIKGFELAQKHIPDIIISDIMMPEMDGNELCKRIKDDSKTCHIPLIMLTAKDTLEERIEGISKGADAYISKPFRADHLTAQINNLLDSRKKLQQTYKEKYSLVTDNIESTSYDDNLLKKFVDFIDENIANSNLKVEDVAQELAYSYMQFNRKIKALTGESVGQFITHYRLKKAKLIFEKNPTVRVSDVMTEIGFNTHSHFSKLFKTQFGLTPKEFREKLIHSSSPTK
ncbi:hybrid sensor histidine kinase/response regulator transcription factor [Saccharicrinis fermentans]|uniref:histidine kinase n=1 Tax=Saccharicrinis fermentans DSM 9555 = JCM 21142 TaxID=869213 RepID=W7Y2X1_9BACT|nr:hybrid sensor histidine kinase/response regulator transcription factor [Saccharicrinis fermentans]GAF01928.1 sensor protein SrrB [Saccharicrinis fermentans DSM 9555 = JCM 21142]